MCQHTSTNIYTKTVGKCSDIPLHFDSRLRFPRICDLSSLVSALQAPNYSSRDEEDDGTEEEGEALEEVQRRWVDGVEEAASHQRRQTLYTGNRGKQGTLF